MLSGPCHDAPFDWILDLEKKHLRIVSLVLDGDFRQRLPCEFSCLAALGAPGIEQRVAAGSGPAAAGHGAAGRAAAEAEVGRGEFAGLVAA